MYVKVVGEGVPNRVKVTTWPVATWPETDTSSSASRPLSGFIREPGGQRLHHVGKKYRVPQR